MFVFAADLGIRGLRDDDVGHCAVEFHVEAVALVDEPAAEGEADKGAVHQSPAAGRDHTAARLLPDERAAAQSLERVGDDLCVRVALFVAEHVHRHRVALNEQTRLRVVAGDGPVDAAGNGPRVGVDGDRREDAVRGPAATIVAHVEDEAILAFGCGEQIAFEDIKRRLVHALNVDVTQTSARPLGNEGGVVLSPCQINFGSTAVKSTRRNDWAASSPSRFPLELETDQNLQGVAIQKLLQGKVKKSDEKFFAGKMVVMQFYFSYELPKLKGLEERLMESDGLTVNATVDSFVD